MNKMKKEIIVAGFGGQGILSLGKILAHAGLIEGKMSYTVYKDWRHSAKTMLCDEDDFTRLAEWAHQKVGTNNYWYITNDLTGEIVYINEK